MAHIFGQEHKHGGMLFYDGSKDASTPTDVPQLILENGPMSQGEVSSNIPFRSMASLPEVGEPSLFDVSASADDGSRMFHQQTGHFSHGSTGSTSISTGQGYGPLLPSLFWDTWQTQPVAPNTAGL